MKYTEEDFQEFETQQDDVVNAEETKDEATQVDDIYKDLLDNEGAILEQSMQEYDRQVEQEMEATDPEPADEAAALPASEASTEQTATHQPSHKRKGRRWDTQFMRIVNGTLLLPLLRRKYVYPAIWIFFLLFCNILLGYVRIEKLQEIDRLERTLKNISYKQLFVTGEISKLDKEEVVRKKLQEMGSTLEPSDEPPYVIYYGESKNKD